MLPIDLLLLCFTGSEDRRLSDLQTRDCLVMEELAGAIPPKAVVDNPKKISLQQMIFRDSPAPFNCTSTVGIPATPPSVFSSWLDLMRYLLFVGKKMKEIKEGFSREEAEDLPPPVKQKMTDEIFCRG
ncbi:hypothetical protein HHK36_004606 [Tetracentron sinense]|uniref:Uncharacterized protein n=1 Tax=Tetracentron sinense TaxID=13715 RepID=A0A834ZRH5_TETSI|nr:hypothetical protein HHK36_004606 [Tetracentron sinense]